MGATRLGMKNTQLGACAFLDSFSSVGGRNESMNTFRFAMWASALWLGSLYQTLAAIGATPQQQLPVVIPGEYLVQRAAGITTARLLANLTAKFGPSVRLISEIPDSRIVQVQLPATPAGAPPSRAEVAATQLRAAATLQSLDSIEPVVRFQLADSQTDVSRAQNAISDAMNKIGLSGATHISSSSPAKPIVVAVIDTGVFTSHEIFKDILLRGADITKDPNGRPEAIRLPDGSYETHGTGIAGVVALMVRGGKITGSPVANIKILPIRATDTSETVSSPNAIRAIKYAVKNGATIICASWGSSVESSDVLQAIDQARLANVSFVAAAGNGAQVEQYGPYIGYDIDAKKFYPASWPLANIVAVGALGLSDSLAAFSNFGASSVKLAAPGYSVMVPNLGVDDNTGTKHSVYQATSGTSIAAPFVAGAIALYSAAYPTASQVSVISRAELAVTPSPALNKVVASGGYLSIQRIFATNPNPPADATVGLLTASYVPSRLPNFTMVDALRARITVGANRNDAPQLRGNDSGGSLSITPTVAEFLVRLNPGTDAAEIVREVPAQFRIINRPAKVSEDLYSFRVESSLGKISAAKALKDIDGVASVEAPAKYVLQ
jgi:subtilisin family serine protease